MLQNCGMKNGAGRRLERARTMYNELGQAVCRLCGSVLDWSWEELCGACKDQVHSKVADFWDSLELCEREYIDRATDGMCISEWARRAV